MELLHKRQFDYYCKITNKVDLVNYIKTVMANNFIEEIYSLFLNYPNEFKQALNQIEYLYSKKLNCFVYPPRDYIKYKQGTEQLREVA
jgi:DNA repair protein RadC|tara:strand:- start:509 stop:772 length:264 start_codon:yes stop_codon:yes gene_type:complete